MDKSTFTPLYEHFRRKLVEMREKAGMTQRALAAKLGREHSFVSRIELGERRLDVVELFWVARACGRDPKKAATELMRDFAKLDGGGAGTGKRRRSGA
jgi:transcriptional regulator with XRE-family HTH domain